MWIGEPNWSPDKRITYQTAWLGTTKVKCWSSTVCNSKTTTEHSAISDLSLPRSFRSLQHLNCLAQLSVTLPRKPMRYLPLPVRYRRTDLLRLISNKIFILNYIRLPKSLIRFWVATIAINLPTIKHYEVQFSLPNLKRCKRFQLKYLIFLLTKY